MLQAPTKVLDKNEHKDFTFLRFLFFNKNRCFPFLNVFIFQFDKTFKSLILQDLLKS